MDTVLRSPFNGAIACGAKCQDGHLCTKAAMANGRCKTHRGGAPKGALSPAFKHGRYSKELPVRMQSKYNEARADREYLALSDDIALIDSRLADVLSQVDSGESGQMWLSLHQAVRAFQADDAKPPKDRNREADLESIWTLVQAGVSDYAAWADVRSLLEQRRKTVESEQKRLIAMQELATGDQVAMLFGGLSIAVNVYVTDPFAKEQLSRELDKLASAFLGGQPA